ncbi:polysaccharide deacetylase family protein [uncultured Microbulbifer sp.]|mgnify:CR=1 FL=1|uniref:polysaccharide deacetylase family protein n=1 Tax=uncultured Microbulbifer sp. TaxID=348147 RepID=UPI0025E638BA|nr:polysaccharide deacetylase family protein [uncultured Microbulbifer sp.]
MLRQGLRLLLTACVALFAVASLGKNANDNSKNISPWPGGAEVAVVLTYDDALDSHLDIAIPQLNAHKLPGTFYLSGARPSIRARLAEWRSAAAAGHELGNHMLYHPCRKSLAGRDWVKPWQDLDHYTLEQFVDELQTTNSLLAAIDGERTRSFAYPCGDMQAGGEDIVASLKRHAVAARFGSADGQHAIDDGNFYQLESFDALGKSGDELIAVVEAARAENSLVGFMFHGVGGDYLTTSAEAHRVLLDYLAAHPDVYWVATVRDAVAQLQRFQGGQQRKSEPLASTAREN